MDTVNNRYSVIADFFLVLVEFLLISVGGDTVTTDFCLVQTNFQDTTLHIMLDKD